MTEAHPQQIWQERGRWCVQAPDGIKVFTTREEAIAFSTSAFADGASPARADIERGDEVAQPEEERHVTDLRAAARSGSGTSGKKS